MNAKREHLRGQGYVALSELDDNDRRAFEERIFVKGASTPYETKIYMIVEGETVAIGGPGVEEDDIRG